MNCISYIEEGRSTKINYKNKKEWLTIAFGWLGSLGKWKMGEIRGRENNVYICLGGRAKEGRKLGIFHPSPPKCNLSNLERKHERKRLWLVQLLFYLLYSFHNYSPQQYYIYILCNESIRINLSFLSSHFSPQLN